MQSFNRGGGGTGTGRVPQASVAPRPAPAPARRPFSTGTPVFAEIEPPSPIVAIMWDRNSSQSWRLGSLLFKECRNGNNWGMFNYWKLRNPPEWTNEHPDTSPEDVQLNCAPMEALAKAKQVMEASPLCSRFTIRTTSGQTRTLDDLAHVEWMKPEDMSEPVQPVQSIAEETLAYDEDQQYLQDVQMTEMLATKVARVATPGAVSTLNTFRICAG